MTQEEYDNSTMQEIDALIVRRYNNDVEDVKRQDIFTAAINATLINCHRGKDTPLVEVKNMLLYPKLHDINNVKGISIKDVAQLSAALTAVSRRVND